MKSLWIGAAIGALAGLGLATTAVQAAPAGMARAATVAGDSTPVVTQTRSRHWRHHHRRYSYRHYRPRYGYRHRHYHRHRYGYRYRPYYYGWVAPRRYYRPYYGYYGYGPYYRRPGFSIWF